METGRQGSAGNGRASRCGKEYHGVNHFTLIFELDTKTPSLQLKAVVKEFFYVFKETWAKNRQPGNETKLVPKR